MKNTYPFLFFISDLVVFLGPELRGFEDFNGKRREEPAFATIPTVSA